MVSLCSSLAVLLIATATATAHETDPRRPYTLPDADLHRDTTSILNHTGYLTGYDDKTWYLDNIPFIDVPDQLLQDVYYYRQSVVKRHLKYVRQGHGWIFTEFIHPVAWASKFQTIPDSAGHHIVESRWLRNIEYSNDVIQSYTRAGVENITGITFTNYVIRAAYEQAQVTGDSEFLVSQLDGMIQMFQQWAPQFDSSTGLYFRTPVQDAQEYSLAGYLVGGPNGGPVQEWNDWENDFKLIDKGPETYRPSVNAYMVANAHTIAEVAKLAGRHGLAKEWRRLATKMEDDMTSLLWDEDMAFWLDVMQEGNVKCKGRQLVGYFPYRFGIGTSEEFIRGLEKGVDSDHFITEWGPTTLEQTNEYYTAFKNSTTNTAWNGQSWPFSTSVWLQTLAMIARENKSSIITPSLFHEQLNTYTKTNTLEGIPFVGEAHYPTIDAWSGLDVNHSENYFHSTYTDNIFTNLLGIIPTLDDRLELKPLIPDNWTHFAIENIPYHGTLISLLWDKLGDKYAEWKHSAGFSIYVNGNLRLHQETLTAVNVTIKHTENAISHLRSVQRFTNILANPNSPHQLPNISSPTSYTPSGSYVESFPPWKLNDGLLWYDTIPDNRWTSNGTSSGRAFIDVQLPRPRKFNSLTLAVYAEGNDGPGSTSCPDSLLITDGRTGDLIASRNPWTDCRPNELNTIMFASPRNGNETRNATTPAIGHHITTDKIRVVVGNKITRAAAFSELQIWVPTPTGPRYEAEDGLAGTFVGGFNGNPAGMNATHVLADERHPLSGGVQLGPGGWVEIADVRSGPKATAKKNAKLTIIGSGKGTVEVQMNFLKNITARFRDGGYGHDGRRREHVTVDVDFLMGGNVVTIFRTSGEPFIDALVVE